MPETCSACDTPAGRPVDRRALIAVVDEGGRSAVCDLCLIALLSKVQSSNEITVFMARRAEAVA